MSALFSINASITDLNKHGVAVPIIMQILNAQSQPIHILEATDTRIVLGMRVNLNQQQSERLILKPMREYLQGYDVQADFPNRKMYVEKAVVNKNAKRKPAKTTQQKANERVSGLLPDGEMVEPAL